jgi:hypothetical protein
MREMAVREVTQSLVRLAMQQLVSLHTPTSASRSLYLKLAPVITERTLQVCVCVRAR